jgi:hypothetical protein
VDVERGGGGRREEATAEVELCGFLDRVDGADDPEVGDGGGEGLAFVWRLLVERFCDVHVTLRGR